MYLRSDRQSVSPVSSCITINKGTAKQAAFVLAVLLTANASLAQNQPQGSQGTDSQPRQTQPDAQNTTVTIPAGTRFALVLTHPIQSRYIHRGDDIYAQTSSPVSAGDSVVIPPGTFVQGKVERLDWHHGRPQLHLQSLSITFADGFVAAVSGPVTMQSDEGYALKDPGNGRLVAAFALPAAGAGLGALIGHSVGSSDSSVTTTLPPGCIGGPPFCLSTSTPVFGTKSRDAIIGAGIGGIVGGIGAVALIFGSHHFFLDVWSPVEMVLQQPLTLEQDPLAGAIPEEPEHAVPGPAPLADTPPPSSD
jgi:hypothetical protein